MISWGVCVCFLTEALQFVNPRPTPKNLLRLFFRNNLTGLKITSEIKNNLKGLFLALF